MCGIIGFAGKTETVPTLLDGLERLEYRGYDSAGAAVVSADGRLQVKKSKGRLSVLRELLDTQSPLSGNIGIGHTRWATHGEPNDTNAHPHMGQEGKIAVVHNGIIENYLEIKQSLSQKRCPPFNWLWREGKLYCLRCDGSSCQYKDGYLYGR